MTSTCSATAAYQRSSGAAERRRRRIDALMQHVSLRAVGTQAPGSVAGNITGHWTTCVRRVTSEFVGHENKGRFAFDLSTMRTKGGLRLI